MGTVEQLTYRQREIRVGRNEERSIMAWCSAGTEIEERNEEGLGDANENFALRQGADKTGAFEEVVGTSAALRRVLSRVTKVAHTDATVLITGETGTGKELIARAVHRRQKITAVLARVRGCQLRCGSTRPDRIRIVWT